MYELRDAFLIALVMSSEAALMCLAMFSFLRHYGFGGMRPLLALLLVAGVGVGVAASMSPPGSTVKMILPVLDGTRFYLAVFLLFLAIAMRGYFVDPAGSKGVVDSSLRGLMRLILCATCFFWFLPEGAAVTVAIAELGVLEDREALFILSVAGGVALPLVVAFILDRIAMRLKAAQSIALSMLLCYLFAIKVLGMTGWKIGLKPIAMRFVVFVSNIFHDTFHMFFVMLQMPDHPFLKNEVYQGILYFLSPLAHAIVAAMLVSIVVITAWKFFLKRPWVDISTIPREPERRIARAAFIRANSRAGVVVCFTIAFIWAGILIAERSQKNEMLDPVPQPVIGDGKGFVVVPLDTMMSDTIPSQMHKYSYSEPGMRIVFMTIRRPDKTLALALDMCNVCQPKGYAQLDSFRILCKYCNTPIPISTVGVPGGCNPIPIEDSVVEAHVLRIPRNTLVETYKKGMKGKR